MPLVLVKSASVDRTLETASGETPPVAEETVVMEAVNMDEEQPPPVYVIAGSAPVETGTSSPMSLMAHTPFQPRYTDVVVSRGIRDFGFELRLSEVQ